MPNTSGPQPLDRLEVATLYLKKYIGIDMALKTVCYTARLRSLWSLDPKMKSFLDENALAIVDCRMLCNTMKHICTLKSSWSAFQAVPLAGGENAHIVKLLTVLSFFFRAFEQLFGDLGYLQKVWFSHWNRQSLSNNYKMYKTFSLLCCALLEVLKLLPLLRRTLHRLRHSMSKEQVRGHMRRVSSMFESPVIGNHSFTQTASCIASPMTLTPNRSPESEPADGGDEAAPKRGFPPRDKSSPGLTDLQLDQIPAHVQWTRNPSVRSSLFLLRNIADLLVYSQWMSWYTPYKTLEFACGTFSGAVGVFIVWVDCEAELLHLAPPG